MPESAPIAVQAIPAIPLGLYVHLPWCISKCPYCDFNSYERDGAVPDRAYVEALLADLALDAPQVAGRRIDTIFIGGGTPSLFSGAAIARLLDGIRERLDLDPAAEITLEANPGAVDSAAFSAYRAAGVNRLSIGVQSLRAAQLKRLGRVHSPEDVAQAVAKAGAAGFDNFNLDLMHGLPGDRKGDSLRDLERALEFAPEHLSWYQLTIEPGTAFGRRPPRLPPHDRIAADFEAGALLLAARGYTRYEVSAFARPGRESRHNLNYWRFGDYLGVGAGAHAKLTTASGVIRTVKRRQPAAYMKAAGTAAATAETRAVAGHELIPEFMLNALRLKAGFARAHFTATTGLAWGAAAAGIAEAVARGWIADDGAWLTPTDFGYRFLDDLQLLFVAGSEVDCA